MHGDVMPASTSALLTFLLIGAVLFSLGYTRARWVRAKDDYLKTKAAVKPLRKDMWRLIWQTVKVGFWVVFIFIVLVAWNLRDADRSGERTPAKVGPSATARR